ncbi:hypothetical protein GCM10010261_16830 [Streptomyces pilosus]|nr:hypothetical protein GCM10010261_16830 [Streptomyces pilosus]
MRLRREVERAGALDTFGSSLSQVPALLVGTTEPRGRQGGAGARKVSCQGPLKLRRGCDHRLGLRVHLGPMKTSSCAQGLAVSLAEADSKRATEPAAATVPSPGAGWRG